MTTRAMIDEFLSHKKLALVRLSPTAVVAGARIDDELRPKGYEVTVVYMDGSGAGPGLGDLEGPVEGVIIAVPKKECENAVRQAIDAGVPRIWIQAGCDSKEALALAEANGTPVVQGACVLMYAEPVKSFHAFHRWLWKTFGLLAK